ncbi:MAG: nicotinate-nucleotide adenylyltransferase [Alphaproteobacteria bacterium]|nr:nicotinate-nucleotide adenylyltransferase [Alphaproteobacteria bacterium]MDE2013306.1 nicotinate-nucleotide adenylyltransferase [Alphaproteobacteria bacterium]MDE2350665.1 nicotinate-nucleotide adenylyltransferase [Alphaproteobacteria bacterium]
MGRSVLRRKPFIAPPGPVAPGLTIGLLGGSFNPAHEGHCHVSAVALKRLGLDYVWWMVAPQNPLKPAMGMAPLDNRLRFARAHARHPRLVIMDIERDIGTRYTIDTLKALQRRFPQVHFVWLMGSDNLASLHRWRRWQDIVRLIPIAVVMRPGTVMAPLKAKAAERFARARVYAAGGFARRAPPALIVLDGPRNRQSATAIRAAATKSRDLVAAVPTC